MREEAPGPHAVNLFEGDCRGAKTAGPALSRRPKGADEEGSRSVTHTRTHGSGHPQTARIRFRRATASVFFWLKLPSKNPKRSNTTMNTMKLVDDLKNLVRRRAPHDPPVILAGFSAGMGVSF